MASPLSTLKIPRPTAGQRPAAALVLILACAGGVLGYGLHRRALASWHALAPAPEPLQRIQAATADTVFALGISGREFAFRDRTGTAGLRGTPRGEWTAALPAVSEWELAGCGTVLGVPAAVPPQPELDRVDCWVPLEGGWIGLRYALLADGRVWRWSTTLPFDRVAAPACLSFLGALIAAGLALIGLRLLPSGSPGAPASRGVRLHPPASRTNGARRPQD